MFRFYFDGLLLFYDLTIFIVYYRHAKLPELMFLLIIMMFFFQFISGLNPPYFCNPLIKTQMRV